MRAKLLSAAGVMLLLLLLVVGVFFRRNTPSGLHIHLDSIPWESVTVESANLPEPRRFNPSSGELLVSPITHGISIGLAFAFQTAAPFGPFISITTLVLAGASICSYLPHHGPATFASAKLRIAPMNYFPAKHVRKTPLKIDHFNSTGYDVAWSASSSGRPAQSRFLQSRGLRQRGPRLTHRPFSEFTSHVSHEKL